MRFDPPDRALPGWAAEGGVDGDYEKLDFLTFPKFSKFSDFPKKSQNQRKTK